MDGRPDDLLEEPLFLNGAFIRRWDDFARLPRPDGGIPGRAPGDLSSGRHADVPTPRTPAALDRAAEPTVG